MNERLLSSVISCRHLQPLHFVLSFLRPAFSSFGYHTAKATLYFCFAHPRPNNATPAPAFTTAGSFPKTRKQALLVPYNSLRPNDGIAFAFCLRCSIFDFKGRPVPSATSFLSFSRIHSGTPFTQQPTAPHTRVAALFHFVAFSRHTCFCPPREIGSQ